MRVLRTCDGICRWQPYGGGRRPIWLIGDSHSSVPWRNEGVPRDSSACATSLPLAQGRRPEGFVSVSHVAAEAARLCGKRWSCTLCVPGSVTREVCQRASSTRDLMSDWRVRGACRIDMQSWRALVAGQRCGAALVSLCWRDVEEGKRILRGISMPYIGWYYRTGMLPFLDP
jgi:hypothetical protein